MLKKALTSNRYTFMATLALKELLGSINFNFSKDNSRYMNQIRKYGVVKIENYKSAKDCDAIVEKIDEVITTRSKRYENDLRIWGGQHVIPEVNHFYEDAYIKKFSEDFFGERSIAQTTLIGKINFSENTKYGSGGGWHRDSYSKNFKAILYLTDVTEKNGPFKYIPGSHRLDNILKELMLKKIGKEMSYSYPRFNEDQINFLCKNLHLEPKLYPGKKGDLILVDTRGIHTGHKLEEGKRLALTNYYISISSYQKGNEIERLDQETKLSCGS